MSDNEDYRTLRRNITFTADLIFVMLYQYSSLHHLNETTLYRVDWKAFTYRN